MTFDDILLKALEGGGPVTVNDILKRYEGRVRMRLNKTVRAWRSGPRGHRRRSP
jgi:hypothetical protein